jgi:hypothetical protein
MAILAAPLLAGPALAADVELPVEPPSSRTVDYEEVWRTDPYSDEYLMGNITEAAVDDDGNFYFLDTQLQEVFKFDADGNFVDTVVHKGEGPGEIDQVYSIAYWSPDTLVLPKGFPPQVTQVSTDGIPLERLHVFRHPDDEQEASINDLLPVGDRAIVSGSMFLFSSGAARIR